MKIGYQMQKAANYVANHPGCCIRDVARFLMPHCMGRNNAYGYNPVHRAISAGLIHAVYMGGRYTLTAAN